MLEIRNLGKTYPNGAHALGGIDLTVQQGEIVALVGGSGCGKSTLLRLISGLDQASHGTVEVEGEVIRDPHPLVGIVFQEPRLLPWLSVAENVGFGLAALPPAARQAKVAEALERVGLGRYGAKWPRELSGGQSQRVALARALVTEPHVLLLDEPFSALDAFTRADLQDHLITLWERYRPTLVLVTHDIEEALVLATRIVIMQPNPGRIARSFEVALPRPRQRHSEAFDAEKRRILKALNATLAEPPAREDGLIQGAGI